jgi:hypothetical protein
LRVVLLFSVFLFICFFFYHHCARPFRSPKRDILKHISQVLDKENLSGAIELMENKFAPFYRLESRQWLKDAHERLMLERLCQFTMQCVQLRETRRERASPTHKSSKPKQTLPPQILEQQEQYRQQQTLPSQILKQQEQERQQQRVLQQQRHQEQRQQKQ